MCYKMLFRAFLSRLKLSSMKPNRYRNEWNKQKCVKKRHQKSWQQASKRASVKIRKEDDEEAQKNEPKQRTNPKNCFCAAFELICFFLPLLSLRFFCMCVRVCFFFICLDFCLQCKVFQTIYSLAKHFIIKLSMVLRLLRVLNMCLDSPDYFCSWH